MDNNPKCGVVCPDDLSLVCVLYKGHGGDEHHAEDGTRWITTPPNIEELKAAYESATFSGPGVQLPHQFFITCSEPKCSEGEHVWDGPTVQVGSAYSVSCSKCGISAFEVDTFMGGW